MALCDEFLDVAADVINWWDGHEQGCSLDAISERVDDITWRIVTAELWDGGYGA